MIKVNRVFQTLAIFWARVAELAADHSVEGSDEWPAQFWCNTITGRNYSQDSIANSSQTI